MRPMPDFPPGPCAETDPELFFPERWQSAAPAVALCRSCESRVDCLAWSITTGSWEGVFGGFAEEGRRAAARRHARGVPLEVIVAEDDAEFYARMDRSHEIAVAAAERRKDRARQRYAEAMRRAAA